MNDKQFIQDVQLPLNNLSLYPKTRGFYSPREEGFSKHMMPTAAQLPAPSRVLSPPLPVPSPSALPVLYISCQLNTKAIKKIKELQEMYNIMDDNCYYVACEHNNEPIKQLYKFLLNIFTINNIFIM